MPWWQGLRVWYLRRFLGFVAAPRSAGGQGTNWQQHRREDIGFTCQCGRVMAFGSSDLVIRERRHISAEPDEVLCASGRCNCPISDARFVKICQHCHLGHWKDASPQTLQKLDWIKREEENE